MNNEPVDIWTSCLDCGQRVTGDSIHTCSPQIKELSDEEILQQAEWMFGTHFFEMIDDQYWIEFAKAILKKASQ
jgi:hypothetical protein